jgi:hypothetical protein
MKAKGVHRIAIILIKQNLYFDKNLNEHIYFLK